MESGKDSDGRLVSATAAVLIHGVAAWWLLDGEPAPPAPPDVAIQVHWIEPAIPSPAPAPTATPRSRDDARPPPVASTHRNDAAPVQAAAPAAASSADAARQQGLPDARMLLDQARDWAAAQAPAATFAPDPLRPSPRTDAAPERFHISPPLTAADVVAGIGQLLSGPGYESDPCPSIRRNVARLAPAGDSELLQEELRRLRQCK